MAVAVLEYRVLELLSRMLASYTPLASSVYLPRYYPRQNESTIVLQRVPFSHTVYRDPISLLFLPPSHFIINNWTA